MIRASGLSERGFLNAVAAHGFVLRALYTEASRAHA
jgi:hypothetical protein